jgi:hypothetical protein
MRDLYLTCQIMARSGRLWTGVRPGAERFGRRLLGPIDGSRRKRAP